MKILVYFEGPNQEGRKISTVGMNNLMILSDNRIKNVHTWQSKITDTVHKWHPYRTGRKYEAYEWNTDNLLFTGVA